MSVVVAFVSKKGGVGKSTLARALATVAVRRGLLTTLADLDSEQQTTTRWQRLRERNAILPPITVRAFDNADGAVASEQDVDLLILDAPGHAPRETLEVVSVAHLIVQPSGAGFDDLQPAVDLFYQLAAEGVAKSRLLMVLSRLLDADEEEAARAYLEVADFKVLPGSVTERAQYRNAHNRGLAFIESSGEDLNAAAAVALDSILTLVVQKLAIHPSHRSPIAS
jgi:chromosome partitioning protein